MLYNNNIFILLIYIFIVFSVIFTIIVKPQFIEKDIENNIKKNKIEKFENKFDSNFLKQNFDSKRNLLFQTTYKKYIQDYDLHNPYIDDYRSVFNHLYDVNKETPFFTFMCLKHDIETGDNMLEINNMSNELNNFFYTTIVDIYINNTNDIINKVNENITKVLLSSTNYKLKGPVFIILYQSPFLRFNNKEIIANYDMNNMKPSYNQQHLDVTIGNKKTFVKMILLFPYYRDILRNNVISRLSNDDGINKFKDYFSNESLLSRNKLCFIECKNNNSIGCGCLNRMRPLNSNDTEFYQSTCLNNNEEKTNYGMMYKINSKYLAFKDKFINDD